MGKTRLKLVSLVLCTTGILALFVAGCRKEQDAPSAPAAAKPTYREQLKVQDMKRSDLRKVRSMLEAQMREKIEAARVKFAAEEKKLSKEAFTALLKTELEKDPEWNSLYKRCEDAAEALEDNRRKTVDVIRERMLSEQKKPVSKKGEVK